MEQTLKDEKYHFIKEKDKRFLLEFDRHMNGLGFCNGGFTDGFCWGKYMLLYTKTGAKSKNVAARVYIKDDGIALRLFLNGIDAHRAYIENAPDFIRDVFTNPYGDCGHCHNEKDGGCRFRKTYTIGEREIEKCNGIVFQIPDPPFERIPDYISLLAEFYPQRKQRLRGCTANG